MPQNKLTSAAITATTATVTITATIIIEITISKSAITAELETVSILPKELQNNCQ